MDNKLKKQIPKKYLFIGTILILFLFVGMVSSGSTYVFGIYKLLPKTGQTTSYVDYDDGYYEAGSTIDPRFVDNGDGTVSDKVTGLMWVKNVSLIIPDGLRADNQGVDVGVISGDTTYYPGDMSHDYGTGNPMYICMYEHTTAFFDDTIALDLAANPGAWIESPWVDLPNGFGVPILGTWDEAIALAPTIDTNGYAGHSDWRMANVFEVYTLANLTTSVPTSPPAPYMQSGAIIWTSSTSPSNISYAFYIRFDLLEIGRLGKDGYDYAFMLVRDGDKTLKQNSKTGILPKTGQTTSYTDYDDGYYEIGNPKSPRFIDNEDGTVSDRATGLMWVKGSGLIVPGQSFPVQARKGEMTDATAYVLGDAVYDNPLNGGDGKYYVCIIAHTSNGGDVSTDLGNNPDSWVETIWLTDATDLYSSTFTWGDAITNVEALDFAGYTDWRMPNYNELRSICNYEIGNEYSDFTMDNSYYWSSTVYIYGGGTGNSKFTIQFSGCYEVIENKNSTNRVMPVRGGNGV